MASSILIFVFGLIVGSFLNCVIYRLEIGKSFLRGRSFCPDCKHMLSWLDLIPVLSFLFLAGKCRYCRKKISWQYPIIEISTALIFLLIYSLQIEIYNVLFLPIIFSLLIVIFVIDLKHFIIPDKVLFLAVVFVLIYRFFDIFLSKNFDLVLNLILSAVGASGFFLAIYLVSKGRWIGFGDVKLAFFMGLFLGFPSIIIALYLAFTIGAIIGVGLILLKKKGMKSEIPFGPFLIIGTLVSFFWGPHIVNWYFSLFL